MNEDDYSEMLADYQQEYLLEQEYAEMQDALPPHKRDGYAERMYEWADIERKRAKGE